MLSYLTAAHWLTIHGLVTVVAVLFYVISSHVMQQRRHPAAAIAWMLFILLVPYLTLPAFLTFGSRKLARPGLNTLPDLSRVRSTDAWAIETIVALGQPAPEAYHDLNVHRDGQEASAALLDTIDAARSSIGLCTIHWDVTDSARRWSNASFRRRAAVSRCDCCSTAWAA